MPADTENEPNFDEIKRLLARGLVMNTAKEVAEGKRDEAFEVARADEERTLRTWCRGKKNIPTALVLQLRIDAQLPMCDGSDRLMFSSPS